MLPPPLLCCGAIYPPPCPYHQLPSHSWPPAPSQPLQASVPRAVPAPLDVLSPSPHHFSPHFIIPAPLAFSPNTVQGIVREGRSEDFDSTEDDHSEEEEGEQEESEEVPIEFGEDEKGQPWVATLTDSQSSPDGVGSGGGNDSPSSSSSSSTPGLFDARDKDCACREGVGGPVHDKGGQKPFHRWLVAGASGQGVGLNLSNFDLRSLLEILQT
jgi:hypothetical protein